MAMNVRKESTYYTDNQRENYPQLTQITPRKKNRSAEGFFTASASTQ